jgi:hypothetical protein
MAREDARQYWEEQLSEYWGSGFSIPEYCELKGKLPANPHMGGAT